MIWFGRVLCHMSPCRFFNAESSLYKCNQAKSLQHSLEQAAGDNGLDVNANKMEYMCLNQKGDISTLKGGSLKQVDKFSNLRSSV